MCRSPTTAQSRFLSSCRFTAAAANAEGMVKFCGLNETADKHGFIVVYPNGTGRFEKLLTFNGATAVATP